MKNYFNIKFDGRVLFSYFLPIYISYLLLIFINLFFPVPTLGGFTKIFISRLAISEIVGISFSIIYFYFSFLIYKICASTLSYKGESLIVDGDLKKYLKIVVGGLLLVIVTFGIYGCWYERNLRCFFAESTSYKNHKFKFEGTGGTLFKIYTVILVTFFVAAIFLSVLVGKSISSVLLLYILLFFAITVLIFMTFRWQINWSYDNKRIKMSEGGCVNGVLFISREIFFLIITWGLYFPFAAIKIYRYYLEHVVVCEGKDVVANFGCDIDVIDEFSFIFTQFILTVITLGLYSPWAFSKICTKLFSKTYLKPILKSDENQPLEALLK